MTSSPLDPYPVPSGKVARGRAAVPASKSIAHRALILAALARGLSSVAPIPEADDVAATVGSLRALGVDIRERGAGSGEQEGLTPGNVLIRGSRGVFAPPRQPLDCRSSGTTLRLLMGVCGVQEGTFTLDGTDQLRRRPVSDLEAPLLALGAQVRYADRTGFPPVVIRGRRWTGGKVEVQGRTSSQFLSGLLLAAPLASGPLRLVTKDLVSAPYAAMTAALMGRFGVPVERPDISTWCVNPGTYESCRVEVEPDTSAAAFLWAAAAVTGGEVVVEGTAAGSLQGDAVFPDLLARMGCRVTREPAGTGVSGPLQGGLDADVRATPDLVPALVAVACFAPGPTTLSGVGHLRFKESDRLSVLAHAVTSLGGALILEEDRLTVLPAEGYRGCLLDPEGDHRMAMAFAIMGLRVPGVRIKGPACVSKSFPDFFTVLEGLLAGSKGDTGAPLGSRR